MTQLLENMLIRRKNLSSRCLFAQSEQGETPSPVNCVRTEGGCPVAAKSQRTTPPPSPGGARPKGRGPSGNPAAKRYEKIRPATFGDWVAGARVPTLSMSISPVLV